MAKHASNYKASATEFGKRLTALYKLKIFPRLGKEFADELFKSGVEAGANISALGSISDAENKIRVATDAIVKLNQTAFAAQVMVDGGFYTAEQIAPISAYIEKLIEALGKLISSVKERKSGGETHHTRTQHRVIVEQKPVVKRRVIVHSSEDIPKATEVEEYHAAASEEIPQTVASEDNSDPDGFSAPYKK